MKKAIFFDIDGTLIHSSKGIKEITKPVKDAIHELQRQGHLVWVATGRPYGFLSDTILEFGFDGFILANGAHIMYQGETIYKDPMDSEFVTEMVQLLEEHHIQYILEGENVCYMKKEFKECGDLYVQYGVKREMLKDDYDLSSIVVYKMEMLCPDEKSMKICLDHIRKHPEYDDYHSMSLYLIELYPKKNTKATGILQILDRFHIPVKDSYAFGDGKNDIEMLQTVGCGIAMENAGDDVKIHADHITGHVDQDGVAKGIYQYILNRKEG